MHKNLSMLGDDQIERYCCGKEIMTPANATSTKTYMLKYWRQKSVLTDNNAQFFRDDIWKFRSFLLKGREYWIGNLIFMLWLHQTKRSIMATTDGCGKQKSRNFSFLNLKGCKIVGTC